MVPGAFQLTRPMIPTNKLYMQRVRCKKQNRSAPHLVIDEANDRRPGLLLNAALTLQQQGLLQLRIMSQTMPDRIFERLAALPHDVVDLGGMPFGLRIVQVRCDQDQWLAVSKAIIQEMRQPGYSSLMFVTFPPECDEYAKWAESETPSGGCRHTVFQCMDVKIVSIPTIDCVHM